MQEKWDLKTYCDILGVSENSPQYEIHAAYQKAKKLYSQNNPQLNDSFTPAEALALENLVEEAFAILGNHSLRSIYQRKNDSKLIHKNHRTASTPQPRQPKFEMNTHFEEKINGFEHFCGENLKKIREYRGISLKEISEITKIKSTYIIAIESDDFDSLPAPVYTRGFLIQIAKVLGLPTDDVATSYLGLYKNNHARP